ncbi:3-deoxy-manno-octulosonate cytidylyltransferase [Sandaracinus amylolyticus]|uniref:3-deoxy-manno-octulosonate cytidylyltransferase n=1 Tax=Sandaracinus amylolyticus TaxID=927083 RepID=UPI001F3B0EE9|nr:3-deoxy-manno-octulosonate cytidylyltransferase [Sandaracinus amylolyticus]UJR86889.1 Hypothetical protein I5071_89900 [Sandaracinus amylolyticus]
MSEPFRVVVPARYSSSRLPAKALAEIAGKPLVVHVWEKAVASGAVEALVATDDARIAEVIERAGGVAMMTSPDHATGTDRLAEVARRRGWSDDAIVVNLQGDEPLVPITLPARLAGALASNARAGIATFATPIHEVREVLAPQVVKVVLDRSGYALYFSRAPIPYARDAFAAGAPSALPAGVPYLRHLGLYAYRAGTLRTLAEAPVATHERAESLEQLRALELGIGIHVSVLDEAPQHGVDTPEDLERVRRAMAS